MSRRQIIKKYRVLDAADTITDPQSVQTDVSGVDFITYEIDIDSTVLADLYVQYCNDDFISDSSTFKDLDFEQTLALNGSNDSYGIVHISNQGFKWLKLYVLNQGGTGNVTAHITGTVRGA